MNHPDSFMPFYGNEFFEACTGLSELTTCAYLRAIWHYWHHLHCAGFEDDAEKLRRVCRIDRSDWAKVQAEVFDNDCFFTMDENGLWRQKKADDLWQNQMARYSRASMAGKIGMKARWSKYRRKTNA